MIPQMISRLDTFAFVGFHGKPQGSLWLAQAMSSPIEEAEEEDAVKEDAKVEAAKGSAGDRWKIVEQWPWKAS